MNKPEVPATAEEVEDMYQGPTDESGDQGVAPPAEGAVGDAPPPTEVEAPVEQAEGDVPAGDEGTAGDEGAQSQHAKPLSAQDIRRIAQEEREEFLRQQEAQKPAPQLSAAEIKQLLQPIEVTKEEVAAAFGIADPSPEQLKAIESMLAKAVKNSTSLNNLMLEKRARELQAVVEPLHRQHIQAEGMKVMNQFHTRHPAMKQYDELVKVVSHQISPTKANGHPKTNVELFDEVASGVKSILAKSGVVLSTSPSANPAPASGVPRIAARQQPGRSVASQASGKANNPDDDIYS
jgi:hypothetical protein